VSKLRSRLSYANVTATVALFLALGGGAIAALKVPKKSVGAKQLRAKAVKTSKLADGAVTDPKVAAATLTAAKVAPGQLVKGVVAREAVTFNQGDGAFFEEDIQCGAGEQAVGGGAAGTAPGTRSFPSVDTDTQVLADGPVDANGQATANGQIPTGWHISAQIRVGSPNKDIHLYALCAQR
jgi:hypothetical protein